MSKEIRIKIENLCKQINYYSDLYYKENTSEVSDAFFDSLLKELIRLENKYPEYRTIDSPTNRVGGSAVEKFSKEQHSFPMLSLANAFNKEDLLTFNSQILKATDLKEVEYICELKIDGVSISLVYENNILTKAITRGNGTEGELVTNNIKTIRDIPLKANVGDNIIRGELFIDKNTFNSLNKTREEQGLDLFLNPRNTASGAIRQLDSKITKSRNLKAFIYYSPSILESKTLTKQSDLLDFLGKNNFSVNPESKVCKNIDKVIEYVEYLLDKRNSFPYEIDGIVIKVNDYNLYETIGKTSKHPKWAIAYKFPAELKEAKILDIFPTVGRTGKITYNAKLEPTNIMGSVVRASTLHNLELIKLKDIRINDTVFIHKAGDIIPEVLNVNLDKRPLKSVEYSGIDKCPSCETVLNKLTEVDQFCLNELCPIKQLRLFEHFVSRNAMNIEGLSEKTLEKFIENKIISSLLDIFTLEAKKDIIIELDNFGEKSFANLIFSINNAKQNSADKLLFALGIKNVGKKTAQILMEKFESIEELFYIKKDDLTGIYDIGNVVAQSIVDYFNNELNLNLIKSLKEQKINMLYNKRKLTGVLNNKINTKKFVITGKLANSRKHYEDLILQNNGDISSSISKNTDYLLAGNDAGSKLTKAKKLNIKIINEEEFIKLMEDNKNE